MNITEHKEFKLWTQNDNEALIKSKGEALDMFCKFHSKTPAQFIEEVELARKEEQGDDDRFESGRGVSSQRLKQFYDHMTKLQSVGGLGYSGPVAEPIWQFVRSFYTCHGIITDIESMAEWGDYPKIAYIRDISFGEWDWKTTS